MDNTPKLTRRQGAIISAYTGILCGKWEDTHEYIEEKMGRSVWTHELADRSMWESIKEASKCDFVAICNKGENNA